MKFGFADRMENVKPSAIREITKLTQKPGVISFAGGYPAPELFPIEEMKQICSKVLDESGKEALQYTTTEGFLPLRKHIVERMRRFGVEISEDQVLLTNGSQQGLDFTGKLFLNDHDVIICESPTYVGAISAFRPYRPRFAEVAMDEGGMRMDALEQVLQENPGAKFIYTIPDFQNPTGITLEPERRKMLMALSARYQVPVIEDNPYAELGLEGERLPAVKSYDAEGAVIYLGSFSKIFCPGLRIGWIAAAPEITRKYVMLKQAADLQVNTMAQRELAAFVYTYDIESHIARIRDVYRARRDLMLKAIESEFPDTINFTNPGGGLFIWVELPEGADAANVFQKAIENDVAFVPGAAFYPNGGHENTFRLNYSNMSEEKIIEGIKRLGQVLKAL